MVTAVQPWIDRPLTVQDLDELPEDDTTRYEVIDGELYMSPFPTLVHQQAATELLIILGSYLQQHPIGRLFTSNTKVVLSDPTGVGPDLIFIANDQLGGRKHDGFYGPPTLVVEITSSKPNLDRVVKYRKYASAGVPHYWIIDPEARTLEAFELEQGEYVRRAIVKANENFSPRLFPGLQIDLGRLW